MAVAYISCLGGPVSETSAFTQGDSTIFLHMVGYDFFGSCSYYLMINMHCSSHGNEFMFSIATADRHKNLVENTFDSTIANGLIPKQHRPAVARVLYEQTEKIVRYMNKDTFFMVTYLDNLPAKALDKYERLNEVFKRCGYEVIPSEPFPGKYMWEMHRRPTAHEPLDGSAEGLLP